MNLNNKIVVIQGAQWGSEAKGAVAAAICLERNINFAVRTGTVNAGHTVLYKDKAYKMQQLPTGWVNNETNLVIGPGAYIHPQILARELTEIWEATGEDPRERLFIDYRCGLHLPSHTDRAKIADRHHKMGATGKGCSEAVVDKIKLRGNGGRLFSDWLKEEMLLGDASLERLQILGKIHLVDTVALLNTAWDENQTILVEGTQGTLLDLHLGPYPYTTHKQTQVASWLAEAGLSANLPLEVILVTRTYPIRVAGNSGPMPGETGWPELARSINDRLGMLGSPPRVWESSILAFEQACRIVAARWLAMGNIDPLSVDDFVGDRRWKIEQWTQLERERNPKFVSELHKEALDSLKPEERDNLYRIFESTTVTAKLRRVGFLDVGNLQESVMWNRPDSIALTFANYVVPEIWDTTDYAQWMVETYKKLLNFVEIIEDGVKIPVKYISTGAATACVLPYRSTLVK